jgi:lauroyl/myristoyl acyltransferase
MVLKKIFTSSHCVDISARLTTASSLPRPAELPHDAVARGTTRAITSVVEGWTREHPEQWLWLHRRWR